MLTLFGKLLRKYRIDHDQKLFEMAKVLEVSPAYLSSIEHGAKSPSISLINKAISCYGLDGKQADELLEAATLSKTEHKINVSHATAETKELVAMFARSVETSSLNDDEIKRILDILGGDNK